MQFGFYSICLKKIPYQYDLELCHLTLKNIMLLPPTLVIKCTKLYDHEAYSSVSILATKFPVLSDAKTLTSDLDKQQTDSSHYGD
jgi:hypothetical protein